MMFWLKNTFRLLRAGVESLLGVRRSLRAPTDADQVDQPFNTYWCGPAVAVTLHRLVKGADYPLEQAKAQLMGGWRGNQTSTEDLAKWLNRNVSSAALVTFPAGGAFEAAADAVRRGYYVVLLIYRDGVKADLAHFVVAYAATGDRLLVTDSVLRGGTHRYEIGHRDFEDKWATRVTRWGERTPLILVRG